MNPLRISSWTFRPLCARAPALSRPHLPSSALRVPHLRTARHLTTTFPRANLKITNPRPDPLGNPMTITLTPRAISRIATIQRTDSNPHLALRITVESGGCHGFQYTISLTDSYDVAEGEDTMFQDEGSSARVVMDESSLELLRGSTVDYTMELIGSQFKVLNPMASSSCGCGTSFDIKDL